MNVTIKNINAKYGDDVLFRSVTLEYCLYEMAQCIQDLGYCNIDDTVVKIVESLREGHDYEIVTDNPDGPTELDRLYSVWEVAAAGADEEAWKAVADVAKEALKAAEGRLLKGAQNDD